MWSSKKLLLLTFSALALIVSSESRITMPFEEEEERLLNYINKPAIKSFQTVHGDILDCIDINKQRAFDHRLLKNHSIQLRPTTIPKWTINNNNSNKRVGQDSITCPPGTVIVKRTTLEDLTQARRLKSMGSTYVSSKGKNIDLTGFHFAVGEFRDVHYGAKGNLNIWEPDVSPTQFSLASILIAGGSNEKFQGIRAGWIVYQWLNRNHTRLYTYWTVDGFIKTGCYNTLCPGYIQVSTKIPLGFLFQPVSTYGGQQYEVGISIYQDGFTGDWWLMVYDELVGYWPKSLFTEQGISQGANLASWGGEVYSPVKEKSPSMGSGHFPSEGYSKAAFVNDIEVVYESGGKASRKPIYTIKPFLTTPYCYTAERSRHLPSPSWSDAIFYGGPGGCTF